MIPPDDRLSATVRDNLTTLLRHRARVQQEESVHQRLATAVARRAGTMQFAYVHAVIVIGWLAWNSAPGVPHFDPYPFVMLAMAASVEALFLSTFVLVSQARAARIAEERAELDVQIGLLSEREVTRVLELVSAIASRLGVQIAASDVADLAKDTDPLQILAEIEAAVEE